MSYMKVAPWLSGHCTFPGHLLILCVWEILAIFLFGETHEGIMWYGQGIWPLSSASTQTKPGPCESRNRNGMGTGKTTNNHYQQPTSWNSVHLRLKSQWKSYQKSHYFRVNSLFNDLLIMAWNLHNTHFCRKSVTFWEDQNYQIWGGLHLNYNNTLDKIGSN